MLSTDSEQKIDYEENKTSNFNNTKAPYRQAISLLYLVSCIQPDLTFAVNVLSRRQDKFNKKDWLCVKRVLRYLNGTKNYEI